MPIHESGTLSLAERAKLARLVLERILPEKEAFRQSWQENPPPYRHLIVDRLLPDDLAREIYEAFPEPERMVRKRSIRERKYIAAQLDLYPPILSEVIYAFQEPEVVRLLKEITGITSLFPDPSLYAGGISLMTGGDFLAPHIDNSHDLERKRYRVLNALYYVSPEWRLENGGNLELWDEKVLHPKTLVSQFNRLVVIETHTASWHSVSRVVTDKRRGCVSNYYFSDASPTGRDYFQVTSFTGWPGERGRKAVLLGDRLLRMGIRRIFPKGVIQTRHVFKRHE